MAQPDLRQTMYLGNLPKSITQGEVHNLCVPFGEIKSVDMAMDHKTGTREEGSCGCPEIQLISLVGVGTHKGFCFVDFEESEDCDAAIDNLHLAEVGGRVVRADHARPGQRAQYVNGGDGGRALITRAGKFGPGSGALTIHHPQKHLLKHKTVWETEDYLQQRMGNEQHPASSTA